MTWKEWRGFDEEQVEALMLALREEENRKRFRLGKLIASVRASSTGKLDEAEVMRELGVELDF